jgi:hypothetical protein
MAFQGRLMWRVLGAAGFILAGQQVTSAAFLPGNIAGGGAGEGIDISGDVVDAIDAVNTGDVIQGVTFTNSASPMVSLTGTTPISTNFTAPTYSGQPDDAALNDVLEGVTYPGGSSMVDGQLYKDISFTLAVQQGQACRLEILLPYISTASISPITPHWKRSSHCVSRGSLVCIAGIESMSRGSRVKRGVRQSRQDQGWATAWDVICSAGAMPAVNPVAARTGGRCPPSQIPKRRDVTRFGGASGGTAGSIRRGPQRESSKARE